MKTPDVTIDRAVHHYWRTMNVVPDALGDYYDTLPFPDKPALDDCHLHVSALGYHDGGAMIGAMVLDAPEDSRQLDPRAPDADIVLFAGSCFGARGGDRPQDELNRALKGGLAYYAAQRDPSADEERLMAKAYNELKLGTPTVAGSLSILSAPNVAMDPSIANIGIRADLIAYFACCYAVSRHIVASRFVKKAHKLVEGSEAGQAAEQYMQSEHRIIKAEPLVYPEATIVRHAFKNRHNKKVDARHRQLSVTRPR